MLGESRALVTSCDMWSHYDHEGNYIWPTFQAVTVSHCASCDLGVAQEFFGCAPWLFEALAAMFRAAVTFSSSARDVDRSVAF